MAQREADDKGQGDAAMHDVEDLTAGGGNPLVPSVSGSGAPPGPAVGPGQLSCASPAVATSAAAVVQQVDGFREGGGSSGGSSASRAAAAPGAERGKGRTRLRYCCTCSYMEPISLKSLKCPGCAWKYRKDQLPELKCIDEAY